MIPQLIALSVNGKAGFVHTGSGFMIEKLDCLSALSSLCVISTPLQPDSSAVLPNIQETVKLNEPERLGWKKI